MPSSKGLVVAPGLIDLRVTTGEPGAEQRSRDKRDEGAVHSKPPTRISATVANPLAMNSAVARMCSV